MPSSDLGDSLVKLAQLGFIGLSIALFLLGAIVLISGKAGSADEQRTRRTYLWAAFLSVFVGAGVHIWDTHNSGTVIIEFSPDFEGAGLPVPTIRTPAGLKVPGEIIDVTKDRTLMIYVDKVIAAVRTLNASVRSAQQSTQASQQMLAKYALELSKNSGESVIDVAPTH